MLLRYILSFLTLTVSYAAIAQDTIPVVKIDWYQITRNAANDTTYIINFWATWCIPCVQELPEFEKITRSFTGQKVKVILVSIDSRKKLKNVVEPFVEKKKLQSQVVLLDEPNFNSWVDLVDASWQGSLPATVAFNNSNKFYQFKESTITFEELEKLIKSNQ